MIENPSRHPLFRLWVNITHGCHNPRHAAYALYGANGVTVCERWRDDFEAFAEDVTGEIGERPKGMGFTRIDLNKPFEPENVRWIARGEWLRRTVSGEPTKSTRRERFTREQVEAIRKDPRKQRDIARAYNTSGPVISRLLNGHSYKRIK